MSVAIQRDVFWRACAIIEAVRTRCPSLELCDHTPLLPGQRGIRWIKGDLRRARIVLREDEDGCEVYCDYDPTTDEFGEEEYLSEAEAVRRIVGFGEA